jgi:peroxiredoxin Q/BCP
MAAKKTNNRQVAKTPSAKPSAAKALPSQTQAKPTSAAKEATQRVDVGDPLPRGILEDQLGQPFQTGSLKGQWTVVYFYPKDDTPGCTREACHFQSELSKFKRAGVAVVGISPDPARRHAAFAEKYGLGFTLLADTDRSYAKQCGVLVPKTLYGRTSIGIERTTFLVDSKGVISRVWRKVKVDGHVDAVLAALS